LPLDGLLRGACHRAALCADPLARNDGMDSVRAERFFRRARSNFAALGSKLTFRDIPENRGFLPSNAEENSA
jgi:hypothetical protein